MESGYYSELESLASAPLCLSETLAPYSEGLAPRNRIGKGRSTSSGRRKREFISDEKKDATYWEKRRKNNEAAKRSREKRRISDMVLENRVLALNEENVRLKSELLALKLRFGLITTATYAVKSQQLAGASRSSYYSAYPNGSSGLLNSDSSEPEHSSRGSGLMAGSKYSPRGSLSDVSDGSSSTSDSPEPVVLRDVKALTDQELTKEAEVGKAGCGDIEFISYQDPRRRNPGPGDVRQCGPQGGAGHPQTHPPRLEDLSSSSAVPQPNPVGRRAAYTQSTGHSAPVRPLTIGGLSEALTPHGLNQLHAVDRSVSRAHRVKGHTVSRQPAVDVNENAAPGHTVTEALGGLEQAPSWQSPSESEELEEAGAHPQDELPPSSAPRGFPAAKQEERPFAPCPVIEAPRVSHRGATARPSVPVAMAADCGLPDSEGRSLVCGSQSPELRATALPHKLRLKIRTTPVGERTAKSPSRPRRPSFPPHGDTPLGGGCAAVGGGAELWSESGILDVNALRHQPLNDPERYGIPNGTSGCHKYLSAPAGLSFQAVNAAYFQALGQNVVQAADTLSLHERNGLVSPTEG
ncbi:uncharacterized protein [Chiloscyllium punctatum]|uniref:uncharacterized protein n=1 Tax=Chiloscyllium punctatum TaxID=137246 RepID=UPI003B63E4FD